MQDDRDPPVLVSLLVPAGLVVLAIASVYWGIASVLVHRELRIFFVWLGVALVLLTTAVWRLARLGEKNDPPNDESVP